ncbi:MAG: hypothetical protein J0I41_12565 [Filimonas sp.]|nr:hypothetical protein [Filimonas sp.]
MKIFFIISLFITSLSCNGQKPFTKVICLQYDDQQKKGKVQPDTLFIHQYKNGEIVKSCINSTMEDFLITTASVLNGLGNEAENITTVSKDGRLVSKEKQLVDVSSMACVKSYNLVKKTEETPALERDTAGRIVKVINEKPYSYMAISYPNERTIIHRLYNRTSDNRFFLYDSLTVIQKHRVVNALTINLQQKNVTIVESKYNDKFEPVGFKVSHAEMTPYEKSNNSGLPDDQLFNKLYQLIPMVNTEQEWFVSTFNKDGHPATGIKKTYDKNGEMKTYTLKFVYE